jgi:hypothetical protein
VRIDLGRSEENKSFSFVFPFLDATEKMEDQGVTDQPMRDENLWYSVPGS